MHVAYDFAGACYGHSVVLMGPGSGQLWQAIENVEGDFDRIAYATLQPAIEQGLMVLNPVENYRRMPRRDAWHFSKAENNPAKLANMLANCARAGHLAWPIEHCVHFCTVAANAMFTEEFPQFDRSADATSGGTQHPPTSWACLLYTSDAADE